MARIIASIVVALLWLTSAASAGATQIVTFGFTGVVTELLFDRGLFGPPGTVAVGDPFSGRFSYAIGPGNADQEPADAATGRYALTGFAVDGSVAPLGSMSVVVRLVEPVGGVFPDPGIPGSDRLTIVVESVNYARAIQFRIWAPYQTVFADDSLPTDLDLTDFTELAILGGFGPGALAPQEPRNDIGALTSLFLIDTVTVPEPAPLAPLAFGIVVVLLAASRRQRPPPVPARRSTPSTDAGATR
jgi:hypothetical protein